MTVLGMIAVVLAVLGNLSHLLFTVWTAVEQWETGWGYGTNMEMAVLMPWLVEVLCIPAFLLGVGFLLLTIRKPVARKIRHWCMVLYGLLALQIAFTNLFIHM